MKIIEGIHGRIIFASLLEYFRLRQAAEAAVKTARKIVVFWTLHGKAIVNGIELGYIKVPCWNHYRAKWDQRVRPMKLWSSCVQEAKESQWQPLSRLHPNAPPSAQLHQEIPLSSSPIPGNTTSVNKLINTISEGCRCHLTEKSTTSIPLDTGQQNLCSAWSKPKYFMPVHGEYWCRRRSTQDLRVIASRKTISSSWVRWCPRSAVNSCSYRRKLQCPRHLLCRWKPHRGNRSCCSTGAFVRRWCRVRAVATVDFNRRWFFWQDHILSRFHSICVNRILWKLQRILFQCHSSPWRTKMPISKTVNGAISMFSSIPVRERENYHYSNGGAWKKTQ